MPKMRPREAKRRPRRAKRRPRNVRNKPNGTQRYPIGAKKTPKTSPDMPMRTPRESQDEAQEPNRGSKATLGDPKKLKKTKRPPKTAPVSRTPLPVHKQRPQCHQVLCLSQKNVSHVPKCYACHKKMAVENGTGGPTTKGPGLRVHGYTTVKRSFFKKVSLLLSNSEGGADEYSQQ